VTDTEALAEAVLAEAMRSVSVADIDDGKAWPFSAAILAALPDDRRAAVEAALAGPRCDGNCTAANGPDEFCSLHGRRTAEPAGLDAAWRRVEAALPEGCRISGLFVAGDDEMWTAEVEGPSGGLAEDTVAATGPTPTAALIALAEALEQHP
jgi:hypothetical protein